ncbi:hemicentin-1 isoform X4 [Nematostella vectensis]|uniref:hemicentin-1 isoform X4 n=1 Tax=Nematostella vectensis TaxID=45351 RepID=UPI0020771047|nr:hemicentin-1 isoform X4 [Nematostella vectensis]
MAIDLLAPHQVPSDQRVIIRPLSHLSSCYCRVLLIKLAVLSFVLLLLPHQVFAAADLISVDKYVGEDASFTWQSNNYLEFKFGISNAAQSDIIVNGVLITWSRGSFASEPNTTGPYQGRLYFYGDPSPSADSKHFEITRVTVLDEKVYLVAIMDPTSYKFTALRAWNLAIREAPAFNPPLDRSCDVAEDKHFSITCSASGRPAPNVTWVNKTSGSPVAHGTGSAILSLLKIQRHQAGVYQCQAINDVRRGAITQDITINVQYPPEITPIQNTTVRAGETITLTCAVAGNPTPSVSWSKAGSGHSTNGNVFTKAGATKADTGQYVCTAVNTVTGNTQTRTASTYVMVKYKPSILSKSPDQTVNETIDFLKLTCLSDGYPAPTVTWSRDGVVVSRTSVYYSNSVIRSEAGTYTCTATNEMGSDTTTVQVTVNYKPEMVSSTINTSSWDRKVLSLQCKARGVPLPQITWYKPGGQPITAEVSPISEGSQLQVTTTHDAGDYGQYKCRASNLLGSVERLIYVTQLFAPGPPIITVSNIEASSIKVNWAPPSSDGGSPVIDYKVEVDPAKPPREGVPGGQVVISDLTKNTEYTVKVTARNVVGYGEAGTEIIRTKKQGPPSLPFLKPVDNTTTSEEITLEWGKPDENGGAIQAYIVYFMLTFLDGQKTDWTKTANITDLSVLSYTFKGIKPGRTYSFLVTAYNQYGESARDYTKARVVQVNEITTKGANNQSEKIERRCDSYVAVSAACSTIIAVLLVSNLMSLFYIYRKGRSKQESRIPRGALNIAAIDEDPITMNTIDPVTHTTSASSDVTYANHGSPSDDVTATSTYQSLDRTPRAYPDGRGQARGPREYEAVGGSGPERGGEGQYAELTSTCPDYQPLHIYGNVGGAKGHRGMGTNA